MSASTSQSQEDMLPCGLVPLQNLDMPELEVGEEQKQEEYQEAQPQMDHEEQKDQVYGEQDIQDQYFIVCKDNDRDVRAQQIEEEQKILQQRKTRVEDKLIEIQDKVEQKKTQLKGQPQNIGQEEQEKEEFEELQTKYKEIQKAIKEFKLEKKPQNNSDLMQTNQKMKDCLTDMENEVNGFINKFNENIKIEDNEEDQQLKLDHILNPPASFDLKQTLKKLTEDNEEDYEELEAYLKSLDSTPEKTSKSTQGVNQENLSVKESIIQNYIPRPETDSDEGKLCRSSEDHGEGKSVDQEEKKSAADGFVVLNKGDLSSKCSQESNKGSAKKEEPWINETVLEELRITDLNSLNFLFDQYLEQQDAVSKQESETENKNSGILYWLGLSKGESNQSKDETSKEPDITPEINEKQIKDHAKDLMQVILKHKMSDCALWNILCDLSKHNIKIDKYFKDKLQECKEDLDKVRNKIVDLAMPEKIKKEKEQEMLKKVLKVFHGDLNDYNTKLKENFKKEKEEMIKDINDKWNKHQLKLKEKYQNNIETIARIATEFERNFKTINSQLSSEIEENKKNIESITSLIELNEKREKLNQEIMEINQQIEKLHSKVKEKACFEFNEKIHQCVYTYKKKEALLETDQTHIQRKIDILDAETQERSQNLVDNQIEKTENYENCTIEFFHTPKLEEAQTSALVIPFDEQLRTSNLLERYKQLAKDAGEKLKNACQQYKNQHFRLRTGLATVFPSGNLKFNSIIAAVGPITSSEVFEELMKKTIYSVLDLMIDYNLKSIFIPSFVSQNSKIKEGEYIPIVTSAIKQFIKDNSQVMTDRRIVIESPKLAPVPSPAPAFPHSLSDLSSPAFKPTSTSSPANVPASNPHEESKSSTADESQEAQVDLSSKEVHDQSEEEESAEAKELREMREMTENNNG
ncbi:unnamed protein product [Moneuplotes crassus]|uniref:Macro domain-containing protein n=1 Tax=Euplotes crassus TaxID=5936 RepID=A0AAD1X3V0_EUPCR|nr:unnamed protein product [Moneuplotes crassus]